MRNKRIGFASISREEVRWAIANIRPLKAGMNIYSLQVEIPAINEADIEVAGRIDTAGRTLTGIVNELSQKFEHCDQAAVSCFGPFVPPKAGASVDNPIIAYFQTDLDAGGKSLIDLFLASPYWAGKPKPFIITDAASIALGEYYTRFQKRLAPFKSDINDQDDTDIYARKTLVALILGKGVGGGTVIGGQIPPFQYHPEMGHAPMQRMEGDKRPNTECLFHKDCATGMLARTKLPREKNGEISNEGLELFAFYAAQLCATVTYMIGPDAISLSGSMIRDYPETVDMIKASFKQILRVRRAANDGRLWIAQESDDAQEDYISASDPRSSVMGTLIHALNYSRYADLRARAKKREN